MSDMTIAQSERRQHWRRPLTANLRCSFPREDDASFEGEAIDISQGGARFCLRRVVGIDDIVELAFLNREGTVELKVVGVVQWVRPLDDVRSEVGCIFARRLSFDQLNQLQL